MATALVHCPSERVLEQAGRHIAVMVTAGIDAALALTSFAAMTTMTAHHALDLGDPDPLDVTTPATSELESFESSLELMLRGLDAVARA